MTPDEVHALLEANRDERGVKHWKKLDQTLTSHGIGLTKLRKLAKQIGRDRDLAAQLWTSDVYDARVISLLIDDPKRITREQAETQVEDLAHGMLTHVFASCDATLAKAPIARDVAVEWLASDDPVRRECGYTLVYELSKSKRKSAPDDAFFQRYIQQVRDTHEHEPGSVRMAMAVMLMGVGKRSRALNADALDAAEQLGPVVSTPGCDPFDATKHLTSPYVRKKLGLG